MNVELMKKINQALDSDVIGLIDFDADEIEEMIADCKRFYKSSQSRYIKGFSIDEIAELVVLIINISKTWDSESDNRYWTKLFGEIFDNGSISSYRFYDDFETCLKHHRHVLFRSKENKRMFQETFLYHALAPEASSDAFIKLLWSWYTDKEVMNCNYQKDDNLYYKMGFYLKTRFAGEKDFDSDTNFEGKTYTIKASLKYMFTQDTETGIRLIDQFLYYIDKIYYNEKITERNIISEKCNNVISRIFAEDRVVKTRKRRETINTITDYNNIRTVYEIDDDLKTYISFPEIRAIDEIADQYEVSIFAGQKVVCKYGGEIYGQELKRRIRKIQIPLEDIIKFFKKKMNLRVTLSVIRNNETVELYDSHEDLYRTFVLFSDTRELRNDVCKPGNYYIIRPEFLNIEETSHCSFAKKGKHFLSVVAVNDDFILTEEKQVYFSEELKKSYCVIDGDEIENLYYEKAGEEIQVYDTVYGLSLLLDTRIEPHTISVIINSDRKVLSSICTIKDNIYYINLEVGDNINKGDNKILVYDTSRQKILHSIEFYVDEDISLNQIEYTFDTYYPIFTMFYKNDEVQSFSLKASDESKEFVFQEKTFIFYYPYIKWSIDDIYWQYEAPNTDYWCNNPMLHNNCIIQVENHSKKDVTILFDGVEMSKGRNGIYLLGDSLTEGRNRAKNSVEIRIGDRLLPLFTVYNQPQLQGLNISLDGNYIDLSEYFIGDEDQRFHVVLENEDDDSYRYDFYCNIIDSLDFSIEDGVYSVKASTVDMWGNEKPLYYEEDINIGNPNKYYFKGCQILLTKFKSPEGKNIKLNNITVDGISYLRDEGEVGVYSGMMHDKRLKFEVELYIKDNKALRIYIVNNNNIHTLGYDQNKHYFVNREVDDITIIPCVSCYYELEEL